MVKINLTEDEATLLKQVLQAVTKTFRKQSGLNIGSSQVYNLYWSDIENLLIIHDKLPVEL